MADLIKELKFVPTKSIQPDLKEEMDDENIKHEVIEDDKKLESEIVKASQKEELLDLNQVQVTNQPPVSIAPKILSQDQELESSILGIQKQKDRILTGNNYETSTQNLLYKDNEFDSKSEQEGDQALNKKQDSKSELNVDGQSIIVQNSNLQQKSDENKDLKTKADGELSLEAKIAAKVLEKENFLNVDNQVPILSSQAESYLEEEESEDEGEDSEDSSVVSVFGSKADEMKDIIKKAQTIMYEEEKRISTGKSKPRESGSSYIKSANTDNLNRKKQKLELKKKKENEIINQAKSSQQDTDVDKMDKIQENNEIDKQKDIIVGKENEIHKEIVDTKTSQVNLVEIEDKNKDSENIKLNEKKEIVKDDFNFSDHSLDENPDQETILFYQDNEVIGAINKNSNESSIIKEEEEVEDEENDDIEKNKYANLVFGFDKSDSDQEEVEQKVVPLKQNGNNNINMSDEFKFEFENSFEKQSEDIVKKNNVIEPFDQLDNSLANDNKSDKEFEHKEKAINEIVFGSEDDESEGEEFETEEQDVSQKPTENNEEKKTITLLKDSKNNKNAFILDQKLDDTQNPESHISFHENLKEASLGEKSKDLFDDMFCNDTLLADSKYIDESKLSDHGNDTMVPSTNPDKKLEVILSEKEMTEIILSEQNQTENIKSDDQYDDQFDDLNNLDESVEDLDSQYQSEFDYLEPENNLPVDEVPDNGAF